MRAIRQQLLFRVNILKLFCSFRVGLKGAFYVPCEPLLIIVQENRSMRNIKQ